MATLYRTLIETCTKYGRVLSWAYCMNLFILHRVKTVYLTSSISQRWEFKLFVISYTYGWKHSLYHILVVPTYFIRVELKGFVDRVYIFIEPKVFVVLFYTALTHCDVLHLLLVLLCSCCYTLFSLIFIFLS